MQEAASGTGAAWFLSLFLGVKPRPKTKQLKSIPPVQARSGALGVPPRYPILLNTGPSAHTHSKYARSGVSWRA